MNTHAVQKQSSQELQRAISEKREELRAARFQLANGKLKNMRLLRALRREIARLETANSARRHAAA